MALAKSGSGTLTLTGANTYTGGTTISGGVLQAGSTAALGAGSLATASGATLDLYGNSLTVSSLSGSGGTITDSNTTAGTSTLSVNQAGNSTYAGVIQNGGTRSLGLAKAGLGTLTLTGTNTYTGGTTLSAGTLQTGSDAALSSTSPLTVNGGVLDLNGHSIAVGSLSGTSGTITDNSTAAGTGTFSVTQATAATYAGALQDGGTRKLALAESGSALLTLTGFSTFTGSTSVNGGSLQLGDGTITNAVLPGTSAIALNGGSLTIATASSQTFDRPISGTGSLKTSGNGTLTLTGANTYGGGTTVSSGSTLQLGNAAALGQNPGALAIQGTLDLNGYNITTSSLASDYGTITDTSATAGVTTLTVDQSTNTLCYATIADGGLRRLALVKSGSGILYLLNSVSSTAYSGGTTINGGVVSLRSGTLGASRGSLTINGGTLNLDGNNLTVGTLSGSGGAITDNGFVTAGTSTLTVNQCSDSAYAGAIQNGSTRSVALVKSGSGVLTLSGANTYTGGTTLTAGTLQAGSLSALGNAGTLTVSGGLLDLHGNSITVGSLSGTAGTITDNSTIAGTSTLTVNQSTAATYTGVIQNGGTRNVALTLAGTGPLTLTVLPVTSGIALNGCSLVPRPEWSCQPDLCSHHQWHGFAGEGRQQYAAAYGSQHL